MSFGIQQIQSLPRHYFFTLSHRIRQITISSYQIIINGGSAKTYEANKEKYHQKDRDFENLISERFQSSFNFLVWVLIAHSSWAKASLNSFCIADVRKMKNLGIVVSIVKVLARKNAISLQFFQISLNTSIE